MNFWKKKEQTKDYIALRVEIDELKLRFRALELDLALILKKLKFKYKITNRDLKEEEETTKDLSNSVLLPE